MDARSRRKLATCHPTLIRLFTEIDAVIPIVVIGGHRGEEAQNEAYSLGNSTKSFPHSVHNEEPSRGIDAGLKPINWEDTEAWYHFGGVVRGVAVMLGIEVRWGGDWDSDYDLHDQRLMDLCHFEVPR